MDCPFSPARLHELYWTENWRPDQIATLAGAAVGELVDAAQVEDWLRAANIALREAPRVAVSPPKLAAKPKSRTGPKRGPELTRPCEYCGKLVTRAVYRMLDHTFCNVQCSKAGREQEAKAKRLLRGSTAAKDLSGPKRCCQCGETKTLADFSKDVHRSDGRTRQCKACNDAKSKAYYQANQERLKKRALERKQQQR